MVIPGSSCFDYVGEFTSSSFGSDEIVLSARSRVESEGQAGLGHAPKVRFWNDRVVIMAADPRLATMRWISFPVGDVVFLVARGGDVLNMVRSGTGDLGLAIVRQRELVVALGAISGVSLGGNVTVRNCFDSANGRNVPLEICIDSHVSALGSRESARVAGYDVYVERTHTSHWVTDGVAECASIVRTGEPRTNNAAMRGAVLLANEGRDTLKGEFWDGRYLRA